MAYNEMRNEIDMLQGNINRMCITSDLCELLEMYLHAVDRLGEISEYNRKRIVESSDVRTEKG